MNAEPEVIQADKNGSVVKYSPTDAEIAKLRARYLECLPDGRQVCRFDAKTPEGYESCRLALRELVPLRTGIEARRKHLKEESLAWGRKVDAAAKSLTAQLLAIEDPIRQAKQAVDDAREAEARAIVEAEKARIAELERIAREAQEAEERRKREAEEARLAEVRRQIQAEREEMDRRLASERAEREKEESARLAERQAIEQERRRLAEEMRRVEIEQAEERRKIQEAKQEVERIERQAVLRREREEYERKAKEEAKAEAERHVAEAAAQAERRKREEEERQREIEAAKPDMQKIRQFGEFLAGLKPPSVAHQAAQKYLLDRMCEIDAVANKCKAYKFGGGK